MEPINDIVQFGDFESAIPAGSVALKDYISFSPKSFSLKAGDDKDSEKKVEFRMNQTGNIYYSTTALELGDETKKLFKSVTVLLGAMTTALRKSGKTLFDYEAWTALLGQCGFFTEIQKFEKTMSIKSNQISLDTQIVNNLLPSLTGNSLEIAKSIVQAIGSGFKSTEAKESSKLGHLLFICEELFGAPTITIRLFFASMESHKQVVETSCHKSTTQSFEQLQESNTFLFVSPEDIAEFADKFSPEKVPEAYNNLVKRFEDMIKNPSK